ncbi:metallo-beta-lactamase superfamily protein [Diaporthe sp. PMI_573]|nr:metallo-beta-lactamase superfamily protein [Diaporthaceae sp. PMI_573]
MALRIPLNENFWKEYLRGQISTLPVLADVCKVTDRVTRVLGGNPGSMQLQGTNTYLVGTGRSRILIDTGQGMPVWIRRMLRVLEELDLEIAYVLLTHWHGDHTGGVTWLVQYDSRYAGRIYKNQPDSGQNPIRDGQVFRVEGATIRAVFTPGHAVDHMCFALDEENALFTGDNVLGHGYPVVEDLSTYIESLHKMEDRQCQVGYPAHGERIIDLPATMAEYLRQKETRIRQVYTALLKNKSPGTCSGKEGLAVSDIVQAVYGKVPDDVSEFALEPFLNQVLWRLAEARMVGFRPGKTRIWFACRTMENGSDTSGD